MVRVARQDLPVDLLRFAQPAGLLMPERDACGLVERNGVTGGRRAAGAESWRYARTA